MHSPSKPTQEQSDGAALRRFGKYLILDRVSTDILAGTATYRAKQVSLGRVVRITVLPKVSAAKPGFAARFQRQVGVAQRLQHDNVISAIDAGSIAGVQYVVFEELDGCTLAQRIAASGPLDPARVLAIGIDAARGLDHVAAQGLVHRNIRPGTIHLPEHAPAKLVGFDVAKVRENQGAETWIDHDVESAECVAPEVMRQSRGIDIRADIYAIGCSLYHAATGRTPLGGGSPAAILARHCTDVPADPRTLREGLPEGLVRILDRCLRKAAAERYAKPSDLLRDLESALAERPIERGPGKPLWPDTGLGGLLRRR